MGFPGNFGSNLVANAVFIDVRIVHRAHQSKLGGLQPDNSSSICEYRSRRTLYPNSHTLDSSPIIYGCGTHSIIPPLSFLSGSMVFHSSPVVLAKVLHPRIVCNHIVSMLNSPEQCVVLSALQLALMLLDRIPPLFAAYFRKEGILYQVDRLMQNLPTDTAATAAVDSKLMSSCRVLNFSSLARPPKPETQPTDWETSNSESDGNQMVNMHVFTNSIILGFDVCLFICLCMLICAL